MGAAVAIDEGGFKDAVEKGGILLIDWWATWCGPCRSFAPIYEEVATENPDLTFAKIDTDANQNLAGAFGIRSIPTLMIFRDRVLLFAEPGVVPKEGLRELIKQVRGLDMEKVRAEMAAEEAEQARQEAAAPKEEPSLIIKP
jgi:thioredoxin 1